MEFQRLLCLKRDNKYIPATGEGKDYVWLPGTYEPLARVDFTLTDSDNGDVLRNTESGADVHLDWTLDGSSGPFVVERSTSFDFSNPQCLGPSQSAKTFDDPALNDSTNYSYRVFRRTLTDALYFYHDDHLGTPIAMTNTSGTLVRRAEHTPFGGIYALTVGTVVNNLRFPGQYFDGETGLAQNWFRDYRGAIGRYDEPEPLQEKGASNLYPYVGNSPIVVFDEDGKQALFILGVGALIALAFIGYPLAVSNETQENARKIRECAPCHGYAPPRVPRGPPMMAAHKVQVIIHAPYHKEPPTESPYICLPRPEQKHEHTQPEELRDPTRTPAWPAETVAP